MVRNSTQIRRKELPEAVKIFKDHRFIPLTFKWVCVAKSFVFDVVNYGLVRIFVFAMLLTILRQACNFECPLRISAFKFSSCQNNCLTSVCPLLHMLII